MNTMNIVWSEIFTDADAEFDRDRRDVAPWFGFVPRVLAVNVAGPYRPTFALWREGAVVERGAWAVDRRRVGGAVRPLLLVAERFADFCRERRLFGAYLALYEPGADAARAAVTAALIREADWCGMFVAEPVAFGAGRVRNGEVVLAEAVAAALAAGETAPAQPAVVTPRHRRR